MPTAKPKVNIEQVVEQIGKALAVPCVHHVEDWRVYAPEMVWGEPGIVRCYKVFTNAMVLGSDGVEIQCIDDVAWRITEIAKPYGMRVQEPYNPGWWYKQREYKWNLTRGKEFWRIWMPCSQNDYGEGRHKVHLQVTFNVRTSKR